jgi:hypothetical protein
MILPQGEIITHACGLELRIYIPMNPEVGKVFIVVSGDESEHRHPVGRSVRAKNASKGFVDRVVEASGGIGQVTPAKLKLGEFILITGFIFILTPFFSLYNC